MAKLKVNVKELLVKKGEYIAFGAAGLGFAVLLLLGITTYSDAKPTTEHTKFLSDKSEAIGREITNANDPTQPTPLPGWARNREKMQDLPAAVTDFPTTGPLFDPTGRPGHKRENPKLWGIEEYEANLIRGAMPGYDIIYLNDGKDASIAVLVPKQTSGQDKDRLANALEKIKKDGGRGRISHQNANNNPGAGPPGPGGMKGPGGVMGPEGHQGFDHAAQRKDAAITYVPLEELDKAIADGKQPAQTVIPLRLIVVNFTIPLKKQLEEVKRAMRFRTLEDAKRYVNFDGYDVKRRVTQIRSNGEVLVIQDWAKYDYIGKYIELIHARKLSDYFEGADTSNKQGPYLPYFFKYEDSLVMPLPDLVPELGSYPPVRLKSITDTIDRLIAGSTSRVDPSDLVRRLQEGRIKDGPFKPKTADDAANIFGKEGFNGPMIGKGPAPKAPTGGGFDNQPKVDIDHLLGRFVDCDVQPGLSYEYQIQLRMYNPNFGPSQVSNVANPVDTKKPILFSPWVPLAGALTVPTEDFLFASDRAQYFAEIAETFKAPEQAKLRGAMQVKENRVVVQAVKWLEAIRMEGKQEPIGGWVVADMPVGRGDYVGKKTFVKLPLWSSESNAYVFRRLPDTVLKGSTQPRGWLVDFSSKSILVDYEGGRVNTRMASGRTLPSEDVATEMLIVREDGKLMVRRSSDDTADTHRKELTSIWDTWIKKVEARSAATEGGKGMDFDRRKN